MILVSLNGGLGNQLFQYALGRRLAIERNCPLMFDLRLFDFQAREYELEHFKIAGSPADAAALSKELWWERNTRLTKWLYQLYESFPLPYYRRKKITESSLAFDPNVLKVPRNAYLVGYWQSEKYFKDIRSTLQDEISIKSTLSPVSLHLSSQIHSSNAVSIHIRRGDYISNPVANAMHGVLPLEYYYRAIDVILSHISDPIFYIFTDDVLWVKENFQIKSDAVIVENHLSTKNYEHLMLMSYCQHHIIANSSFSWWGAWLSANPEKKVIAPKQWFKMYNNTYDILPEEWIKL